MYPSASRRSVSTTFSKACIIDSDGGVLGRHCSAKRIAPSLRLLPWIRPSRFPTDQFHGPAADVDDERRSFREGDTVFDPQENQPGFFRPTDHPHPQSRLLHDQGDEITAVLSFAHGTGRDGDDPVESFVAGQRDQRFEDVQARVMASSESRLVANTPLPNRVMSLKRSRILKLASGRISASTI